jgi:hypothetical protein
MWLARCINIVARTASWKAGTLQQIVNESDELSGELAGYLNLPFVTSRTSACCTLDHDCRDLVADSKT